MTEKSTNTTTIEAASGGYHTAVLLKECIDALQIKPEGTYADCTFGGGGHSKEILRMLGHNGKLVAFDQDADAKQGLPEDERLVFIPQNFRYIQRFLRVYGISKLDGLLADLGVSSHQLNEPERGFSYRFDALLDMRMNQSGKQTAADILNTYDAAKLQKIFSEYGEVTNAKTLAAAITQAKNLKPFKTIADLLHVLAPLSKGNPNRYYSQVFQALRIEVNEELEALKELLMQLETLMNPGGRIAIITFHSLEDRIVKQFFKQGSFDVNEDPLFGSKQISPFRLITKKPIEATKEELAANKRARSAGLRIAEMK